MLYQDGKIFSSKAFCVGCDDTHDCCLFSRASLAQPDSERHCSGSAGLVWTRPLDMVDYERATRTTEVQDVHTCGNGVITV